MNLACRVGGMYGVAKVKNDSEATKVTIWHGLLIVEG